MNQEVEKLLRNNINRYVIVKGTDNLPVALKKIKEENGDASWNILVDLDDGKYLCGRVGEIDNRSIGGSRNITEIPLAELGHPINSTEILEDPDTVNEIAHKLNKSEFSYVVVTILGFVVGIISKGSIEAGIEIGENIPIISSQDQKTSPVRQKDGPKKGIINKLPLIFDRIKEHPLISIISFVILTLIPTFWFFYNDVIPVLFTKPDMMSGEWNVAIAQFTIIGEEPIEEEDASLIGSVFYNRLTADMMELQQYLDIIVQIRGPDEIKAIPGETPEERANNVEALSTNINANIIVYGTIERKENAFEIVPEFYIPIKNSYETEEMVGQHSFGSNIFISSISESLSSQVNANRDLSNRAQILTYITKGLSLFFVGEYEEAMSVFHSINVDDMWLSEQGREVSYLFEGNAALKSFLFNEAGIAYQQALTIEPEYARAYAGLGSLYYLKAIEELDQEKFSPNDAYLEQAISYFERALEAQLQPPSADIEAKVAFGLGQVYLAKWFAGESTLNIAVSNFNVLLQLYNNGENPRLSDFASETYGRLGMINLQLENVDAAINDFTNALDLASNASRKGVYWGTLADIYQEIGRVEDASTANQNSINEYLNALSLTSQAKLKAEYWYHIFERYTQENNQEEAIKALKNTMQEIPVDSEQYIKYQEQLDKLQE